MFTLAQNDGCAAGRPDTGPLRARFLLSDPALYEAVSDELPLVKGSFDYKSTIIDSSHVSAFQEEIARLRTRIPDYTERETRDELDQLESLAAHAAGEGLALLIEGP